MKFTRLFLFLFVTVVLVPTVRGDAVTDWNAIAVQASLTTAGPPGPSARVGPTSVVDIALVSVAMYDAVQAIEKRYEPYYIEVPGASGSPAAAAARAAHDMLVNLYPAQAAALGVAYQNYLAANGILITDPGLDVGARTAAGIIALRSCDGRFPDPPPPPYIGNTDIGQWRPTPPANAPMLGTWMATAKPFLLTRPSQFRSDPPPDLNSRQYARDYNEVKKYGSALGTGLRTPDQTDAAFFWAGNFGVMLNKLLRDVSTAHTNDIAESSRLFALANTAQSDAIFACWNLKIHYNSWRPITAIHNGDADGNPRTAGDPAWNSLIPSPPYPDHVSGANAITGATMYSLERFFGTDHMNFSITTTNTGPVNQDTRSYNRFSEASLEVVEARILLGIHFRFADTAARKLGRNVAYWGHRNYFRPICRKHHVYNDDHDDHERKTLDLISD